MEFIVKALAIARTGLKYSKDEYALENYQELHDLSQSMLINMSNDVDIEKKLFPVDNYPTPSISVRSLIFNKNQQLLMVKEKKDGLWSLPGGWCDLFISARDNAKKECLEESGYAVTIEKLVACFFRDYYKDKVLISEYALYFVGMVDEKVMDHVHEISEVGFFDVDQLPLLSSKNTIDEITKALNAYRDNSTYFE